MPEERVELKGELDSREVRQREEGCDGLNRVKGHRKKGRKYDAEERTAEKLSFSLSREDLSSHKHLKDVMHSRSHSEAQGGGIRHTRSEDGSSPGSELGPAVPSNTAVDFRALHKALQILQPLRYHIFLIWILTI